HAQLRQSPRLHGSLDLRPLPDSACSCALLRHAALELLRPVAAIAADAARTRASLHPLALFSAPGRRSDPQPSVAVHGAADDEASRGAARREDRKSTRLNSSHVKISYAVFCLKKKRKK